MLSHCLVWKSWCHSPKGVQRFHNSAVGTSAASPLRGRVQHVFIRPDKHRDPACSSLLLKSRVRWHPRLSPEPQLPKGWVGCDHSGLSWRDSLTIGFLKH